MVDSKHSDPEPLLPVETLIFAGETVKVGRFNCPADDQCFRRTAPLNNHLLVVTTQAVLWRRETGQFNYAEPGAALLHRRGGEIHRQPCSAAGDISYWFGVREDLFREVLDRHQLEFDQITASSTSVLSRPSLRLGLHQLLDRIGSGQASPFEIEETVLTFVDQSCEDFASCPAAAGRKPAHLRLANRARHAMDHEFRQSPETFDSLETLAGRLGVSVFHLCRVFRQQTGMTLHHYKQRQRLGVAVERLCKSRQDLTDLALDLGFSSHSHFSRTFRRYLGISPSRLNPA